MHHQVMNPPVVRQGIMYLRAQEGAPECLDTGKKYGLGMPTKITCPRCLRQTGFQHQARGA